MTLDRAGTIPNAAAAAPNTPFSLLPLGEKVAEGRMRGDAASDALMVAP
jgi:hypothetical protein